MEEPQGRNWPGVLRFARTRALLAGPRARLLALGVAIVYLALSLVAGGMVRPAEAGPVVGPQLTLGSWTVLLPLGATATMLLVALIVGVGMGAGVLLACRLFVVQRTPSARARALGPLASMTPAMLAALTFGACCSTAAAAWAGLGAVSAGGSLGWLLSVGQVGVLFASLLAQEGLLALFPGLTPSPTPLPKVRRPYPLARGGPSLVRARTVLLAASATWAVLLLVKMASPGSFAVPGSVALWIVALAPVAFLVAGRALGFEGPLGGLRVVSLLLLPGLASGLPLPVGYPFPDGARADDAGTAPCRGGRGERQSWPWPLVRGFVSGGSWRLVWPSGPPWTGRINRGPATELVWSLQRGGPLSFRTDPDPEQTLSEDRWHEFYRTDRHLWSHRRRDGAARSPLMPPSLPLPRGGAFLSCRPQEV